MSRRARAIVPLAALAALAVATPASAAAAGGTASPVATGGTPSITDAPAIVAIRCSTGCVSGSTAQGQSRSRRVAVRPGAVLAIRGRNLSAVTAVVFKGRAGASDDRIVRPRSHSASRLTVRVPAGAAGGPLVVSSDVLGSSAPSRATVSIQRAAPHPKPAPHPTSPGGRFIWPVDGPITSPFGMRWGRMHTGIDIGADTGTPIRAAAAGTVTLAGPTAGYGNFVCIAHATMTTCYAHQSQILTSLGARVSQGQVIGRVGCTGHCTGPHLHFEVRLGTSPESAPTNPVGYLPPR